MSLYDAALRAIAQRKAIRRPSMPPGMTIVPLFAPDGELMKAFLVDPDGTSASWYPSLEDLTAQDWSVIGWITEAARCG